MSQEHVDWVKVSLEHFARTGEPYLEGIDPAVEVFDHDIPDARNPYRGVEGISAWLADFGESWESYEMHVERILDAGDRVVSLFRIRAVGAGSGAPVERDDGIVWTFTGGGLIRVDYFNDQDQALEATGLDGAG
jgi:ketosteroid isomerase-like protein